MTENKPQRVVALDLARILAMLMMVQGHFTSVMITEIDWSEPGWQLWHFMRGLTAPAFLFISGASHVFANDIKKYGGLTNHKMFKRIRFGLLLIFIGYFLEFPFHAVFGAQGPPDWHKFFQVKILHIIGALLIILAIFFKIAKNEDRLLKMSLISGFVCLLIFPLVDYYNWFDILPTPLAAYLSQRHGSQFALFPVIIYIFWGVSFGVLVKRYYFENKLKFVIRMLGISLFFVAFGRLGTISYDYIDVSYILIEHDPFFVLEKLGWALLGFTFFFSLEIKSEILRELLKSFSRQALFIYVAHLVIIYGSPIHCGLIVYQRHSLNLWQVAWQVIVLEIVLLILAVGWDYMLRRIRTLFRK